MNDLFMRAGALTLGVAVPLLIAEAVLRLLPVATGLSTQPVNAAQPVFHFAPQTEFTYSKGWRLQLVNRGRINDAGFVSNLDYRSRDPGLPVTAVIGDSYVEAAMVPWAETVHGRLAAALQGRSSVFGFGASGAPLSQYLVWAQHAREEYGATRFVFVIVGNDFDESLLSVKSAPGFHYFDDVSGSDPWPLVRVDYEPGRLRPVARASALARYLLIHLQADQAAGRLMALASSADDEGNWVGNTDASLDPERLRRSSRAIERFLELLPVATGTTSDSVVLALDGIRPQLYGGGASDGSESYFARMRAELIRRAGAGGYAIVDLQPLFVEAHRRTGARFEFEIDAHWNGAGHEVAARAVLDSGVLDRR